MTYRPGEVERTAGGILGVLRALDLVLVFVERFATGTETVVLNEDRRRQLLASVAPEDGQAVGLLELCTAGVEITEVSGAGIMLMTGDEPQAALCVTNPVSELIEELQFTYGEGPCIDAHHRSVAVSEPDLAAPEVPRWAAFSRGAVEGGVRAVFGFPIQIGTVRLGALNLYRDVPGPLTATQHTDAQVVADSSARTIMATQAAAIPGSLGAELEPGTALRFVVHQASGMVATQLGVGVDEALVRLRAYVFARDGLVTDVAEDVVARRVRLTNDDDSPPR